MAAARRWWMSPPRTGPRILICPWEYRHLRAYARAHVATGLVLVGLGLAVLALGGSVPTAYVWTLVFTACGVAHLAYGYWELSIADDEDR